MNKRCYIIAGPNGAGKTTFAKDFLPKEGECINYINADLIAVGLSPFAPEKANVLAGKLMLQEINKSVRDAQSFAFETTLSGKTYVKKIQAWKKLDYEIVLYYFSLPSIQMAMNRVKNRVEQGGHNIPEQDIRRRFKRSQDNYSRLYQPIVDTWVTFDTTTSPPLLIDKSKNYE